ncbi:L-seryl-tRNA(Sec) selenium transferase [Actinomadura gamaensis]|uniref:L-seryl-tRNA(Sec) selenium transferase n=1 Tax=Actinomadura gamaensis TaxID=1763541 RepID=A0ABV9U1A9_9ACTN
MDPRPHTPSADGPGRTAPPDGDPRRAVPRTDAVLADPALRDARTRLGRRLVKAAVAQAQERVRAGELPPEDLITAVLASLPEHATTLRPVLNATGVLLHTNLGRAPLSAAARDALTAAAGHADVEYDLATGRRGPRGAGTLAALRDACPPGIGVQIVNNNAAALTLAATALAAGREIIVSRGELVEIGDGFRLPDLLTATGARLREVGTTNRTTAADYADAIGPDTGFVLKVHPSNFTIEGFTYAPPVNALTGLGVPLIVDIGSGLLAPHPALPDEPDALTTLKDGAHLVTASADKLLGGPQAGLLLGDPDLLARLRRHPLYRALRVDKLTLAALEATLRGPAPPVRAMLDARPDDLRRRAETLAAALPVPDVQVTATTAVVGGGGAPGVPLPSFAVSLPAATEPALRAARVIGRLDHDRLLLDLRSINPADDEILHITVRQALTPAPAPATPATTPPPTPTTPPTTPPAAFADPPADPPALPADPPAIPPGSPAASAGALAASDRGAAGSAAGGADSSVASDVSDEEPAIPASGASAAEAGRGAGASAGPGAATEGN